MKIVIFHSFLYVYQRVSRRLKQTAAWASKAPSATPRLVPRLLRQQLGVLHVRAAQGAGDAEERPGRSNSGSLKHQKMKNQPRNMMVQQLKMMLFLLKNGGLMVVELLTNLTMGFSH